MEERSAFRASSAGTWNVGTSSSGLCPVGSGVEPGISGPDGIGDKDDPAECRSHRSLVACPSLPVLFV